MADMPTSADFRAICEYNWRVLRDYCDALSELPEEAVLKNREATYQSMKNIFHHIVKVHDGWLNVSAQDDSPDPKVYDGDFDVGPSRRGGRSAPIRFETRSSRSHSSRRTISASSSPSSGNRMSSRPR